MQDANHFSAVNIGKWDWGLQKSTEMSNNSSATKFYGLMRYTSTKLMERPKYGKRRDLLMMLNIQANQCDLGLHGCFWNRLNIFIHDVIHDGSSRMNSEVYRNMRNASELIRRNFIIQPHSDPKHHSLNIGLNWGEILRFLAGQVYHQIIGTFNVPP